MEIVVYPVAHGHGLPREIAIEAVHANEHLILELDHASRSAEICVGNIEISLGEWTILGAVSLSVGPSRSRAQDREIHPCWPILL